VREGGQWFEEQERKRLEISSNKIWVIKEVLLG